MTCIAIKESCIAWPFVYLWPYTIPCLRDDHASVLPLLLPPRVVSASFAIHACTKHPGAGHHRRARCDGAISAFLGTDVRLGTRHPVAPSGLSRRPRCHKEDYGLPICPLSPHPA